jgi:hypothetical protein
LVVEAESVLGDSCVSGQQLQPQQRDRHWFQRA